MVVRKVHVLAETWNRPICGRRTPGVRLAELATAERRPDLCAKCRQGLPREGRARAVRRQPRPGVQLMFTFMSDPQWIRECNDHGGSGSTR